MAKMGQPSHWAAAAAEAIRFEREHFNPSLRTVFLESDDCKLLLATKRALEDLASMQHHLANVRFANFPCTVRQPTVYRARGKEANVTGHDQVHFNAGHSCADTTKYFAALTVFRDAGAALLGPGGDQGVPLSPARLSSNTVLFIEQIRGGRALMPKGRDYHTGRGTGVLSAFPDLPAAKV